MPIYDYECLGCGEVFEYVCTRINLKPSTLRCKECHADAVPIISASGQYCSNQDADWIKSVVDIVDKDSKAPHVQEFIKNPTRKNYQNWMRKEGLRPFEPGEKPQKPPPFDERAHHERVWQKHRERKRIVINRR